MDTSCSSCENILTLETELDTRAGNLVKRVNEFCADTRARNKRRWERFSQIVRLPIVGNKLYQLLVEPVGLERDPDYSNSEWYVLEGQEIEEQAQTLEDLKRGHREHWGGERVEARFYWDPAGYYDDAYPSNPMKRSDAYKAYKVLGRKEELKVFFPDKYDFHSMAGSYKMKEGIFVLDANSKQVVPLNQCNWSSEQRGLIARTKTVYTSRVNRGIIAEA